jgi:uncharacterized membrane protein
MSNPTYWQRLKGHPGVPVAAFMTIGGALAGGWFGLVVGALTWVPVLITARDQPV